MSARRRLAVIGIILFASVVPSFADGEPTGDRATGFIVVLEGAVPVAEVPAAALRIVGRGRTDLPSLRLAHRAPGPERATGAADADFIFLHALRGFAVRIDRADAAAIAHLEDDPDVAFVAEDRTVRLDAQLFQPDMQRIRMRRHGLARINDIRDGDVDADIAVLDTGIDPDHPDLRVYRSVSFVPGDSTPGDPHGHGTLVAGIAAAIDDDHGIHGVAPGARLWAVKVLGQDGTAPVSDVIASLDYVAAHADEIDVVNMSFSGPGIGDDDDCGATSGDPLHAAVCGVVDAGVVVVVSAGNFEPYGRDASLVSPAAYDEVITVSAVVETDGLGPGQGQGPASVAGPDNAFARTFSNYGWDVDIAAPGVDVLSTWPGGGYAAGSGTSVAAPHVAGAAALWIAAHGKPADGLGALHVRDELVRLAFPQRGPDEGFSGDKERFAEPLLNVSALDLAVFDPIEPELSSDRSIYEYGEDLEAEITLRLRGADGEPRVGLPGNAFLIYLGGVQQDLRVEDHGQGLYGLTLPIAGLLPGDYDLTVVVRDATGFERSAGCRIVVHTPQARLLIHDFSFAWPVMNPDSYFSNNPLHASLMDGKGAPLVLAPGELESTFSGGGVPLAWSFPEPDFFSGVSPGVTYGAYRTEVGDVHTLPLGTYVADLSVTHLELTDSDSAAFAVAYPEPSLVADLEANFSTFDFSQAIAPPDATLTVAVSNEWSTGVTGLYYLVDEPLLLQIDGGAVPDVEFVEDYATPGTYVAEEIDIADLAHGPHQLVVTVTDSRGLEVDSEAVTIDVVRETSCASNPLAAGGQPDGDGDGIRDECDNCPRVSNRSQSNTIPGEAGEADLGDACKSRAILRVSADPAYGADHATVRDAVDHAADSAFAVRIEIYPADSPYVEEIVVDRGQSFRFVGRDLGSGRPVVEAAAPGGTIFDLRSAGEAPIAIERLVLRGQGAAAGQRGVSTTAGVSTRLTGLDFEELTEALHLQGGAHLVERVAIGSTVETGVVADDASVRLDYGEFRGTTEAVTLLGPTAAVEVYHALVVGADTGLANASTDTSRLDVRHSTVVGCAVGVAGNASTSIAHSILWNNGSDAPGVSCGRVVWSDLQSPGCGQTNRSLDPMFVDPSAGDYRLAAQSPLLDHGPDPATFSGVPCTDLDGQPRLLDYDGDGLARIDPGAYERLNPDVASTAVGGLSWSTSTTLTWSADAGAVRHHVYRGRLSTLFYDDFGACAEGSGIVAEGQTMTDTELPPQGDGYFYRITAEDATGGESSLGTGTCAERSNYSSCP